MSEVLTVSFDGFVYLVGAYLEIKSRYCSLDFSHVATYMGIFVKTVKSDKAVKESVAS